MAADFFVAGRWRNRDAINAVLAAFDRAGFSSYCFVRSDYSGSLAKFGSPDDPEGLVAATESADLDDPGVAAIFEEDMTALRTARRFLVVMPAGAAAHIEAGVAYGLGKPCYSVGPVEKTETLYRVFDRMFGDADQLASWLASPSRDAP